MSATGGARGCIPISNACCINSAIDSSLSGSTYVTGLGDEITTIAWGYGDERKARNAFM